MPKVELILKIFLFGSGCIQYFIAWSLVKTYYDSYLRETKNCLTLYKKIYNTIIVLSGALNNTLYLELYFATLDVAVILYLVCNK